MKQYKISKIVCAIKGKRFYKLTLDIDSEKAISPQDISQIKAMTDEYEENENHFIVIEDLIFNYIQNEDPPLVREFSNELISDSKLFEDAMTELYLNPRASKYLDDYTAFNKVELVDRAEKLLKEDMRGDNNDH